jgi:hypothetical protein
VFGFSPESVFTFIPESRSESSRNPVRLDPGIAFALPRNPQLIPTINIPLDLSETDIQEQVSAFTVAELGQMLQCNKQVHTNYVEEEGDWVCVYRDWNGNILMTNNADTEADARAKMLCYLLEKKLIMIDDRTRTSASEAPAVPISA